MRRWNLTNFKIKRTWIENKTFKVQEDDKGEKDHEEGQI